MRKRIISLAVLVLMVSLAISATPVILTSADGVPKVSKPFEYSGYTFQEFASYEMWSEYVEMSDGTLIAVDVWVPSGYTGSGPAPTEFPVVFSYTPYQRPGTADPPGSMILFLLSYGYAYVYADMRGSGASFGWKMDFMHEIAVDGAELIDWIVGESWCDGNIGMAGGSYVGWSQTAAAGASARLGAYPGALKCVFPMVIPLEGYSGEVYPGGIYLKSFLDLWALGQYYSNLNFWGMQTTPVVDEDGDGDLWDEVPRDLNFNGMFVDDYVPGTVLWPPQYDDGNGSVRQHYYFNATFEHLFNLIYADWASVLGYIDSISPVGLGAYELGPNAFVPAMMESQIPVYNYDGYFDGFSRGCTELYNTMKDTNPSKMILSPGYHGMGPFWEYLGIPIPNLAIEQLRWFDRWLKGIENGIDKEPPIYIFVMNGEGWRFEDAWPLPQQVMTSYYFDGGNTLATTRTADGSDDYTADYLHDSRYGTNGGNRWLSIAGMAPNEVPWRTEKDLQCLTYTSEPLEEDMEVTGHPIVQFWISSTADYGDFFVYLEDVDEFGEALMISEGQLRAGFAGLYDNDEIIYSGETVDVFGYDYGEVIDVLPELPWHGYEEAEYEDAILADCNVVELLFDLLPLSWVFKEGHRIRVSIAVSDWPTFRLHEQLCPTNDPTDPNNIVPTITVYRNEDHPSSIQLPVIPLKPRVFEGYAEAETEEGDYRGPAELYTFETAVYLHFEDQWMRWEVKKYTRTEDKEFYLCQDGLKVTVWTKKKTGETFAEAKGPKVFFFGSAT